MQRKKDGNGKREGKEEWCKVGELDTEKEGWKGKERGTQRKNGGKIEKWWRDKERKRARGVGKRRE